MCVYYLDKYIYIYMYIFRIVSQVPSPHLYMWVGIIPGEPFQPPILPSACAGLGLKILGWRLWCAGVDD